MKAPSHAPVFIADSCLGGLSVVKSLWKSEQAKSCVFLADYEVNPLGRKTPEFIDHVVDRWIKIAEMNSECLIFACNTLSIKYEQSGRRKNTSSNIKQIISMVDCFQSLAEIESSNIQGKKILIIGTKFTSNQSLYTDIIRSSCFGVEVKTIAATELEKKIAQVSSLNNFLSRKLTDAIEKSDVVILACTCFPIIVGKFENLFPKVIFLDPAKYFPELFTKKTEVTMGQLELIVKCAQPLASKVVGFARQYLSEGSVST